MCSFDGYVSFVKLPPLFFGQFADFNEQTPQVQERLSTGTGKWKIEAKQKQQQMQEAPCNFKEGQLQSVDGKKKIVFVKKS